MLSKNDDKRKHCGLLMPSAYFGLEVLAIYLLALILIEIGDAIGTGKGYTFLVIVFAIVFSVSRVTKMKEVLSRQSSHCSNKC